MKSENRKRKIRIVFYVDEKEDGLIREKMKTAGIINREAYIRKMSLDGYIVRLDLSEVKKMIPLLSNATSNINQIAKRVNTNGDLLESDVADMKADCEKVWNQMEAILRSLANIQR